MASTTEFKRIETPIPGLLEFEVTYVGDERGWFQEKFQKQKLVAAGLPENFIPVQHSLSYNKQIGVTRGFHAEPWEKYIGIIKGGVYAVFVDLRSGTGFGKKYAVTLDVNKTIFLPRGVANSFQTIEDDTYYSYLVNDFWSADNLDKYKFVNLADPQLGVEWPIPLSKAIISEKDRKHPELSYVEPFK